jgi:hypothetical protein
VHAKTPDPAQTCIDAAARPGMMDGIALEIPCPYCGQQMYAEQAHNRCPRCRYIEPCCDGAPLATCESRAPEQASAD